MDEMRAKVAVVGAGASGMAAAIAAAEKIGGHGVLLLEKNSEAGKKLPATGNGRCNFTNRTCTAKDFMGEFVSQTECAGFPEAVLRQNPPERILEFFERIGIPAREEEEGRVYPYSGQGAAVRRALLWELARLGVELRTDSTVRKAEVLPGGGFRLVLGNGDTVCCQTLILSMGGKAGCQYGSSGDGYALARSFGHQIVKPIPALVGLLSEDPCFAKAKGVRVRAKAELVLDGCPLQSDSGEVQFAENGLSGICILNLSRYVRYSGNPQNAPEHYFVRLDFTEGKPQEEVRSMLFARRMNLSDRKASLFLDGFLPERLAFAVLERVCCREQAEKKTVAELTDEQLCRLSDQLTAFEVGISGTRSWKEAQVTAGGVSVREVRPDTLESQLVFGLYFAGELLDVDARCGGYNLQWAFASGLTAGAAAAQSQRK